MIVQVALTVVLSQFVRTRMNDKDPSSQCLWWPENTAIVLHQQVSGNTDSPGDTEFDAVGKAVATWQSQLQSCSSLSLTDGARSTSRFVGFFGAFRNENLALFRARKCSAVVPAGKACLSSLDGCANEFDCWDHQEGAIAITTTSYEPSTGRILDADIEFNTPSFLFTTVDAPPCLAGHYSLDCVTTDIQNTATHELGHLMGLGHISSQVSTMNPSAVPGETAKRVLDEGTKAFVCSVYPVGKPSKTCSLGVASTTLGKATTGCSTTPGQWWPALAAAALLWKRRRA